jgi:hypothetical protein
MRHAQRLQFYHPNESIPMAHIMRVNQLLEYEPVISFLLLLHHNASRTWILYHVGHC